MKFIRRHYFLFRRKTMFEAIAKNIATALFLVCALIVGSILPEKETPEPPSAPAIEEPAETTQSYEV